MPLFPQVAQFFPLILAPGVVALARRQKRLAWIDGPLLVWCCVVGAAVLWTLLLAAAMGEDITRAVVARGVIMGLTSALADTWATRKTADPPEPDAQVPADAPTVVAAPPDVTPVAPSGARAMDLDFGK
jgi:hypothetical protein